MLNFLIFLYLCTFDISCSAELSTKKFYNLGPTLHSTGSVDNWCFLPWRKSDLNLKKYIIFSEIYTLVHVQQGKE